MSYIDSNISNHLPKITLDYINEEKKLNSFYNRSNNIDNYKNQFNEKANKYNNDFRIVLSNQLKKQYESVPDKSIQVKQIENLKLKNTFTVTTGHQLNLFTGPLYFFYKIIDTIIICKKLKKRYPYFNFIPVFWMASEDHDFEEINFFNYNTKKFSWDLNSEGPVGRLKTEGLEDVLSQMKKNFNLPDQQELISLFELSYLKYKNLSSATLNLVHSLFGKYGLLILEPDNKHLKTLFSEIILDELLNKNLNKNVLNTNNALNETFDNSHKPQVNSREINLFYIKDNFRARIEHRGEVFSVLETDISFTQSEIIREVKDHPERFSPNALLRPVYQEFILPNLAYVGGGSEIAYWLQLKEYFNLKKITFPILSVRSSVLLVSKKQIEKCKKFKISISNLFDKSNNLKQLYLRKNSKINIDLSIQKNAIKENFLQLNELIKLTDKSFLGAVKAQEKKQINGIENLEKRLIRAEKRVHEDSLSRLITLKNELFPNDSFQERQVNFSSFFNKSELDFIKILTDNLDPFNKDFLILEF
ncbi:bacillithiol biosynthesis cysteine-adding enzyme BshC [Flavobacteriaceae bacterium]|nr:bacillithiol biosynthesis cysteine-adding enzyme BshC [Flavobacteriaceae bacterium]